MRDSIASRVVKAVSLEEQIENERREKEINAYIEAMDTWNFEGNKLFDDDDSNANFSEWCFALRCASHFNIVVSVVVNRTAHRPHQHIGMCDCHSKDVSSEDENEVETTRPAIFDFTADDEKRVIADGITDANASDYILGILIKNKTCEFPVVKRYGYSKASPFDLVWWSRDPCCEYRNEKILITEISVRKIPPDSLLMEVHQKLKEMRR